MRIEPMIAWQAYSATRHANEALWLAHPGGSGMPAPPPTGANSIRVAVGPEGGFTPDEIEATRAHGWTLIDLGPRILRLETAALAMACRAIASMT